MNHDMYIDVCYKSADIFYKGGVYSVVAIEPRYIVKAALNILDTYHLPNKDTYRIFINDASIKGIVVEAFHSLGVYVIQCETTRLR